MNSSFTQDSPKKPSGFSAKKVGLTEIRCNYQVLAVCSHCYPSDLLTLVTDFDWSWPMKKIVHIVGGGLAGSEAALQLANWGYQVHLYEMRPVKMTEAHKTDQLAELVCSNSFGSMNPVSAPGQLKWEAEQLNSQILAAARENFVPAGQALGIDRLKFATAVTEKIKTHPGIQLINRQVTKLSEIPRPAIIATGPLTSAELSLDLQEHFGNNFLYFFDAIAPIIDAESIDLSIAWRADRYDKGTPDYLNCPLNRDQYFQLVGEIEKAQKITPKEFENTNFFEGCMPIEVMVDRGPLTLRFGPMKAIGLKDPRTGRIPFAVLQLRQENKEATAYNMVGFQTRMTYSEQARIFRMIPGLEKAEFLKLGSIHRNLFINSPTCLNQDLSSKLDPDLYFAGQITGVEGYFESTCMGLLAALNLRQKLSGNEVSLPPRHSALGSLINALTDPTRADHFQPTNINMALFPPLVQEQIKDKAERKARQVNLAQSAFNDWLSQLKIQTGLNQMRSHDLGPEMQSAPGLVHPM